MLTQAQAVEIKVLERQGRSIAQIMRETGLSRNTVRKYLRGAVKVQYGPRDPRPCKLDPFKAYLLERIEQARPDWIPATVLMREIQTVGYAGGISQLKAFVRPFKVVRVDPVELQSGHPPIDQILGNESMGGWNAQDLKMNIRENAYTHAVPHKHMCEGVSREETCLDTHEMAT